ncbi:septation protein SepH [Saccharomonospora sp.]|uniref:septation protein SepH n=1 Tax=Saccharomonospora sp. TaxID=33913 RepID=UPI00262EFF96|nr:septation protein SepH [Saccharomonospora sp.]
MRTLRVVGLHEDGKSIVCEDPERRERFLLPADERLRAAARGDIARLGQIEIEQEYTMRPREIQARIRAGESVEEVASAAGMSTTRVERFAYPVLLERSRTAELAQRAHPVREDGPDVRTLGEVVAHSFALRGQDYAQAKWDAWRSEEGKWVVGLSWTAGRSDNRARWSYSPGAHGGTVTALDELAETLLDPESYHAPRAVGRRGEPVYEDGPAHGLPSFEREGAMVIEAPIPTPADDRADRFDRGAERQDDDNGLVPEQTSSAVSARGKSKKGHPTVPAWEDVLLGVRSQRG